MANLIPTHSGSGKPSQPSVATNDTPTSASTPWDFEETSDVVDFFHARRYQLTVTGRMKSGIFKQLAKDVQKCRERGRSSSAISRKFYDLLEIVKSIDRFNDLIGQTKNPSIILIGPNDLEAERLYQQALGRATGVALVALTRYRSEPFPHYKKVSDIAAVIQSRKSTQSKSNSRKRAPPIEGPSQTTYQFVNRVPSTFETPPVSSSNNAPYMVVPHQPSSSTFSNIAAQQAQMSTAYHPKPELALSPRFPTDPSFYELPESFEFQDNTLQQSASNLPVTFSLQHPASGSQAGCATPQSLRMDPLSASQSIPSSRSSLKHPRSDGISVLPNPDGPSQHCCSPEFANLTSALVSMVGAMDNITTAWRQASTQTPAISTVVVATDMVRDSADLTEDEKIRLYLFLGNNLPLAATVPRMPLGFRKAFFQGILEKKL